MMEYDRISKELSHCGALTCSQTGSRDCVEDQGRIGCLGTAFVERLNPSDNGRKKILKKNGFVVDSHFSTSYNERC